LAAGKGGSGDQLAPGQKLGPFLLLAPLGSGGSGRVWAAVRMGQLGFTKRMALKVMRRDRLGSERAWQRFDREALLGAQLRHFNLRSVHELGRHDGRPYMAMAWVDTSLVELMDHAPNRRLEPEIVCWLGIQVCAALSTAHAHADPEGQPHPIVHGDVSPGNILLTKNGHVQLADLAADVNSSEHEQAEKRRTTQFFGSLSYASPEALKGLPRDGRSDLFSLGSVLYEALCGGAAFEGDDERSVMFQVLEGPPVEVRERHPGVPEAVAGVVRRAMQRRIDERFQSADEMRDALVRCVERRSAFQLEQATTVLIEQVLGERIRAREEEVRLAYQEYSAAQLARTDTLPVGGALRREHREKMTAPESLSSTWRDARESGVAATDGSSAMAGRRARQAAAVLALVTVAYVSIVLSSKQDAATDDVRAAPTKSEPDVPTSSGAPGGQQAPPATSSPASSPPPAVLSRPDAGVARGSMAANPKKADTVSSTPKVAPARRPPTSPKPEQRPSMPARGLEPAPAPKTTHGDAPIEPSSATRSTGFMLPPPDPYQDNEERPPAAPTSEPASNPALPAAASRPP
jgi:eukaryotic-like serine/threonine-protein kinase